jgi:hypothetical protein
MGLRQLAEVVQVPLLSLNERQEAWETRHEDLGDKSVGSRELKDMPDDEWWEHENRLIARIYSASICEMDRLYKERNGKPGWFIEHAVGYAHCAAAPGHLVREAIKRRFQVRCNDFTRKAVKVARERLIESFKEVGLQRNPAKIVKYGYAHTFTHEFKEGTVDLALITRLFYHLEWDEVEEVSAELDHVTRIGSALVVCQADPDRSPRYQLNPHKNELSVMWSLEETLRLFDKWEVVRQEDFFHGPEPAEPYTLCVLHRRR